MAELSQLRTWLSEAENARHELALGQAVSEIWRDGRRMTFNKSDMGKLDSYIDVLSRDIAKAEDLLNGTSFSRRQSLSVVFRG